MFVHEFVRSVCNIGTSSCGDFMELRMHLLFYYPDVILSLFQHVHERVIYF